MNTDVAAPESKFRYMHWVAFHDDTLSLSVPGWCMQPCDGRGMQIQVRLGDKGGVGITCDAWHKGLGNL